MECSINSPDLSLLMKRLVNWSAPKNSNEKPRCWSPRGSLVSIGQHFVATRVVHLPKSTVKVCEVGNGIENRYSAMYWQT